MHSRVELEKYLSKGDFVDLLELINRSLSVGTEDQFKILMKSVSSVVPFESCHVSVAKIDPKGSVLGTTRRIVLGFPTEWFKTYYERKYHSVDPVASLLLKTPDPLIWSDLRKRFDDPVRKEFYGTAADYGLADGFSFGTRFHRSPSASFFVCEGRDVGQHDRHRILLSQLLPHLHVALSKVHLGVLKERPSLTPREIEVLNWAKYGKTNWEISLQLSISTRVVKFHIENAIRKLNASNRTQAIALALSIGLIEWG